MEADRQDIRSHIAESAAGNRDAFHALYELLVGRVFGYVRARTHSHEAATDITQDIFVALWSALPRFTYHSHEQFYAYVFVITKRALAKHYDSTARAPLSIAEDTFPDLGAQEPGNATTDLVARALVHLDPETREIITLHHWSGYTFGEIAALLNITETAARVRHHRGIKTLRAYLAKHDERF